MNMFANMTTEGLEASGDRLGGGGVLDTDVYEMTIKAVYVGKASASNAQSINILGDINGREFREQLWVTNRNGENFYVDQKDKTKKRMLPGFETANELCLVATGAGIAEQDIEEKVLNLYDFDAKKEVPTNVPVLTDLTGKKVYVAIERQIVDKQAKNASGAYENTGETREVNEVQKFFHAETDDHRMKTVTEIREGLDAAFGEAWLTKNKGQTRNRSKGASANAGAPGRPGAAGAPPAAGQPPKTSLFAKK